MWVSIKLQSTKQAAQTTDICWYQLSSEHVGKEDADMEK